MQLEKQLAGYFTECKLDSRIIKNWIRKKNNR